MVKPSRKTYFKSQTYLSQHTLHTSELRREANERHGEGDERSFGERQEVVGWSLSKLKRWMVKREMEEKRATERATKR